MSTKHVVCFVYLRVCTSCTCLQLDLDLQQTLAMLPGYGLIAELDADDGHIVRSYHDPRGEVVREATEVFELDGDNVYIGSYVAPYLVKVNLNPN